MPTIAGTASSGTGVAGSAALQQPHTGGQAPASAIAWQADASPAVSTAPKNAARAIQEKRGLEGVNKGD